MSSHRRDELIRREKKEAVIGIIALTVLLVVTILAQKHTGAQLPLGFGCLMLALAFVMTVKTGVMIYNLENRYCASDREDCHKIVASVMADTAISEEKDISWWVDTNYQCIEPVFMITPTPSMFQRFTNLFRDHLLQHAKYEFMCMGSGGRLGRKLTGDNVYSNIDIAVLNLMQARGQRIEYRYQYLRYPFDSPQYFTVIGFDQDDANSRAKAQYLKMLESKQTVCPYECRPVMDDV